MSFFIFDKNKILLKSGPHKYVQRLPTGKIKDPWRYIYAKDLLKPWTALKEFFSITKERITKEFEKHNIFSTFGVTKEDYGVHVLNYASNKSKWDNFFLNKFNRKKFEKPIKEAPSSPKKKSSGTKTKKTEPKEEEKDFWKHPNKSLMEKVWTLYNPNAKNIIAQSKKNIVDKVINNPSTTPVQEEKEDKKTSERVKAFNALKETFKKSGLIPNDELETLTVDSLEDLQAVAKNIKDTPDLYESEGEDDKKVYLHYFTPNKDYYVCELSEDGEAYGFVDNSGDPSLSEWGYFDCKELVEATYELKGNDTLLGAELDLHFTPKSLKDTIKASGHSDLFKTVGIEDEPTEPAKDETKGFEIYEPPENNEPVEPQGEEPQPFTIIESDEEPTEENEVKEDDFELVETEQEKHENRSNAMLGNDNAKKDGITKEDLSKKYNIPESRLDILIDEFIKGFSERSIANEIRGFTDNPQALLEEIKNSNLIQERATELYNKDVKKQSLWYGCSKYEWGRLAKIAYNLSKKYDITRFDSYKDSELDEIIQGDDVNLLLEISNFANKHKVSTGFVMEEMRKTGKNGFIGEVFENNEVEEVPTENDEISKETIENNILTRENVTLKLDDYSLDTINISMWKDGQFIGNVYPAFDKDGHFIDVRVQTTNKEWKDWEKSKEELTKYYYLYRQEKNTENEPEKPANVTNNDNENKGKITLNSFNNYLDIVHNDLTKLDHKLLAGALFDLYDDINTYEVEKELSRRKQESDIKKEEAKKEAHKELDLVSQKNANGQKVAFATGTNGIMYGFKKLGAGNYVIGVGPKDDFKYYYKSYNSEKKAREILQGMYLRDISTPEKVDYSVIESLKTMTNDELKEMYLNNLNTLLNEHILSEFTTRKHQEQEKKRLDDLQEYEKQLELKRKFYKKLSFEKRVDEIHGGYYYEAYGNNNLYARIRHNTLELYERIGDMEKLISSYSGSGKSLEEKQNLLNEAYILQLPDVVETEQEKHDNRSNAMLGNQNAKKDGVIDDGGNKDDNTRTIGSGLSNTIGEVHTGTDTGNSRENGSDTGTGSDRNEPIQQPNQSRDGFENGSTTSDGDRTGRDNKFELGRVSIADAKKIREKCLEILKKPDSEITAEEKEILRHYEGAGGLKGESETDAQALNEFYTPRDVISKMWDLVDKYIPNRDKKVLEPSAGTGRFMEGRTEKFTLNELDPTSARIAKLIHPEAEIKNGYFEEFFMKNGAVKKDYEGEKYDVVIGNPPYGLQGGLYYGMGEGKNQKTKPAYFIDRGLDTLKDGGVLAYIIPSGFLDTRNDKGKEAIAKKGKILEAWRLPAGTFGTTGVSTDIVLIQKTKGDEESAKEFYNGNYFEKNRSHVLGNETRSTFHNMKVTEKLADKTIEETLDMIDPNAVAIDNEVKENLKKLSAIVEPKEKKVTKIVEKKFVVIGDIKVGNTVYNKDGKKGNITGVNRKKQTFDYFVKDDDGSSLVSRKNDFKDFTVVKDEETAEEISHNRSEGMKGNQNAKGKHNVTPTGTKPEVKVVRKSAQKGDVFTPSTGKNMTAEEFNKKYNKNVPKEDLKFWTHKDWDGSININELSESELKELKENPRFIEIDGKYLPTLLYASGNIYNKLNELEREHDYSDITDAEYERRKALLEEAKPAYRTVDSFTVSPVANFARTFQFDEKRTLEEAFLNYCGIYTKNGRASEVQNVTDEMLPQGMTLWDIRGYIYQEPIRADGQREDKEAAKMAAEQLKIDRRDTTEALFNDWIRNKLPEDMQKKIADKWNKQFNAYVNPDFSEIPLFVEGMNENMGDHEFTLTDQQIKGVSELCNKGNGILAYDVGVGKTACGIVATVNQLQTGKAKKPAICVPKAVYQNWINSIHQHFPNVQVNELGNLGKDVIKKYTGADGKIHLPENAINVMSYEALENITFKKETLEGELQQDMMDVQSVYDYDKNGNRIADKRSDRKKASDNERISGLVGQAGSAKDENNVFFEDLGIDHITVDELHNFKNVFSMPRTFNKSYLDDTEQKTTLGNSNEFSGISSSRPSKRAMKLFAISQLIQRKTDGRGFFGLSATPFNNSPVEIYNILSLCARNRLKDLGIYNLSDFLKEFAETKQDWKVKANGKVEHELVMKNFRNLGSLQSLITEFIDKVDGEEAGVKRPYKRVHKPMLDLTPVQKAIIEAETARMESSSSDENSANTLIAMNNMRMATLSPSLIDPKFFADYAGYEGFHVPKEKDVVEESPKLKFVCDMTSTQYKDRPTEGQVIYMPRGVKQYKYVKEYLVKQGIPADAIAFMDSSTNSKKEEIMKDFNEPDGKIKVIIGSETIKEGVNLNGNSSTIYNTMLGWNPTETIQVEGRIWRQGNKQGVTHVVYPLMNDSIDSLMYQKYDEKSSRLNALWSYKGDSLNVEEINPEEMKFALIKDPAKRADMKVSKDTAEIERQKRMNNARIVTIQAQRDTFTRSNDLVDYYNNRIKENLETIAKFEERIKYGVDVDFFERKIKDLKNDNKNYSKEITKEGNSQKNVIRNLKREGVNSIDGVQDKIQELTEYDKSLDEKIKNFKEKRDDLVEEAKKEIEAQEKGVVHSTVKENVDYYVNEVRNDLRSFENVKSGLEALSSMNPNEIQNVIDEVSQGKNVNVGNDTFTKKDLNELLKHKNKAVARTKKSLVIQDGKFLMIEKAIKPKTKVLIKDGKFYIN